MNTEQVSVICIKFRIWITSSCYRFRNASWNQRQKQKWKCM